MCVYVLVCEAYILIAATRIQLSDEEAELVGLDGIRKSMSGVMDSLKWEYTNVVTSKLNPGTY